MEFFNHVIFTFDLILGLTSNQKNIIFYERFSMILIYFFFFYIRKHHAILFYYE